MPAAPSPDVVQPLRAGQPPGRRQRKRRESMRRVRHAALALFVEHGYDEVSVEQIAESADISRTTFFNYFASKEAVLTEPDPEALAARRALCEARPVDEPLWDSLTVVMMDSLRGSQEVITAQKVLKARSPALAHVLRNGSEPLVETLLPWAESRLPPSRRPQARLQLRVLVAAMTTAFEQWDVDRPFDELVTLAWAHLAQVREAFVATA